MSRRKVSRVYVAPFNGKQYLFRAFSYRDAAKHLVGNLVDEIAGNTRVATPDDVIELMQKGIQPIDITGGGAEGADDAAPSAGRGRGGLRASRGSA